MEHEGLGGNEQQWKEKIINEKSIFSGHGWRIYI